MIVKLGVPCHTGQDRIYSVLPFYAYLVIEGNKTIVIDEQGLSAFRVS